MSHQSVPIRSTEPIDKLTRSLISFQMILVISSPSNSTTGFLTWIFLKPDIFLICPTCRLEAKAAAGVKRSSSVRRAVDSPELELVEAKQRVVRVRMECGWRRGRRVSDEAAVRTAGELKAFIMPGTRENRQQKLSNS